MAAALIDTRRLANNRGSARYKSFGGRYFSLQLREKICIFILRKPVINFFVFVFITVATFYRFVKYLNCKINKL